MNDQRQVIFSQRLKILKQNDIAEVLNDFFEEVLKDLDSIYINYKKSHNEKFLTEIKNILGNSIEEKKLIDLAKPKKNVKYIVLKNLNQIKSKFDIIFISNVLGGIEIKNLYKLNKFLISKLKKNGILFLSEHISNKKNIESEVLKGWAFRSDDFYLNLFKKINLRKVDEYSYNGYRTSIYVGKRKEKVLKNQKKPLKYRK